MTRLRFTLSALFCIVSGAAWFSCSGGRPADTQGSVVIGAVLPLSGDAGTFGKNASQGARLAVEQANAEGRGSFVLKVEDSKGAAQDAVSAGRKLVSVDGAVMLIGDVTSSGTHALLPVINEARVPLVSPSASDPALSGASPFFARVWPSDVFEATVIAAYAQQSKVGRLAVVYANTDYGVAMAGQFRKAMSSGSIVLEARVDRETLDYRPTLERVRRSQAEGLFVVLYPEDAYRLLNQMRDIRLSLPILATATFEDPKLLDAPGADRVVFASPVPPSNEDGERRRFLESYRERFSEDAGTLSDTGFDAARILIAAWRKAGTQGPEAVILAIREVTDYPGVSGKLSFSPQGDVTKPYRLRGIKNKTFVWLDSQ